MPGLDELLLGLAALAPPAQGELRADALEVTVPVETRIDGGLRASLPRGRLATGFDPPLGRVAARFEVREA